MTTAYADPQSIHNPTTGNAIPASWGDTVRDDLQHLATPPGARCRRTATQSINSGSETAVQFSAADERDTDTMHDIVTNNSRVTIPTGLGGFYLLVGLATFAANGTGQRLIRFRVNGTTLYEGVRLDNNGGGNTWGGCATQALSLLAGDYVELMVYQDSGGAINCTEATFVVHKISQ